jgi:hypothetical protein
VVGDSAGLGIDGVGAEIGQVAIKAAAFSSLVALSNLFV